jgi:hypothetical protein
VHVRKACSEKVIESIGACPHAAGDDDHAARVVVTIRPRR